MWAKPAWIALMVLGFVFFWPVGLAVLAYLLWSRRMGCWKHESWAEMRQMRKHWHRHWHERHGGGWGRDWNRDDSSGNSAFDEYRTETLRRLEEEQKEFHDFLDRLRQAKDKAEFDQFMAERRSRQQDDDRQGPSPEGPAPQPQG